MERKYPHLTRPITIGRVTFRNRMFSAPMGGTDITADCSVGPRTPGFYELRAKGGAAAVTANAFTEDIAKTTEAGMNAHISKPIDFGVLCRTLAELTRKDTAR